MSFATIAGAFRTHLETLVLSPTMPIVWENQTFKPEADGGEDGWLYFELLLNGEEQASFGNAGSGDIHRDTGLAIVNVVVPRGSLVGRLESVCDSVRSHFKIESVSGVHITSRWIGAGRLNEPDSRWFVRPVLMEFWADRVELPA